MMGSAKEKTGGGKRKSNTILQRTKKPVGLRLSVLADRRSPTGFLLYDNEQFDVIVNGYDNEQLTPYV